MDGGNGEMTKKQRETHLTRSIKIMSPGTESIKSRLKRKKLFVFEQKADSRQDIEHREIYSMESGSSAVKHKKDLLNLIFSQTSSPKEGIVLIILKNI